MTDPKRPFKLTRYRGQVFIRFEETGEEQPVRVVWTRPISRRGGKVSLLDKDKKEVALIDSLDELDADSRAVAETALDERYLLPVIRRIIAARPHFGNRYWYVETDRGLREFVVKDINRNVTRVTEDHLVIRDTLGNRYEIPSMAALDNRSRTNANNVL